MQPAFDAASPRLKAAPDWTAAAQVLIDGCAHAANAAERTDLLERLCGALGDQLYPAFLRVLCTVGERGTPVAQAAVADALVEGLRSGRVPSGRRAAWGATGTAAAARALGPIEFLCAWHAEPNSADLLGAVAFDRTLRTLLSLASQSPAARALYCARLEAVADDPLGGTLARNTRQGLRALAGRWRASGTDVQAPVDAFLAAVAEAGGAGAGLRSLAAPPVMRLVPGGRA